MVQVDRLHAPAPTAGAHLRGARRLPEAVAADVQVERVAGPRRAVDRPARRYAGDVPVRAAVAVQVGHGAAHAVRLASGAGGEGEVGEGAVALVAVVAARTEVAGHDQLRVAVAVQVDELRGKGDHPIVGNAGAGAHFREAAVAVVAEQHVAADAGRPIAREQVEVAVQVVVPERRRHAAGAAVEPAVRVAVRRAAREAAGAVAAVQQQVSGRRQPRRLGAGGRNEQVQRAVAVEVGGRRAMRAMHARQTGRSGPVDEGTVAPVDEQPVGGAAAGGVEDVLPPVAVEVAGRAAGSGGRCGDRARMAAAQAGRHADLSELHRRRGHRGRRRAERGRQRADRETAAVVRREPPWGSAPLDIGRSHVNLT